MKLIDRLERHLGFLAIPNLTLFIVIGQAIGMFLGMSQHPLIDQWYLIGAQALQGEYHRLVMFIFLPPGFGILVMFALYLFLMMGTALENQWGRFRYTLYVLIAYFSTIAVAFILPEQVMTSAYIGGSVFLAFAWLYPEFELLLFFVLPVKIKYLAWITWAGYLLTLASGDATARLLVLSSILNFVLFFGVDIYHRIRWGHRTMKTTATRIKAKSQAFHRCAICGVTEKEDKKIDFRICSQCDGTLEYCENHLHNHEHRGSHAPVDEIEESS
ncbi:MAG: hypothetical protein O2955_12245 [Planctomycetota bacterium]|nr:hypothetical protein [Planctomycetota bacterium]MDA1213282.1 hypothetical protein [Planctomycetota bacterium]